MKNAEKSFLRSRGIRTSPYKKYCGVLLSNRMEEVLIKLWKDKSWCSDYSYFVTTMRCLEKRGLVTHNLIPLMNPDHYELFKLTTLGERVVDEILNHH